MDKNRFYELWKRCGGSNAEAVFDELAAYYQEPHRHYHCGSHIVDCLTRMDLAVTELGQSDSVELAVWFHDVIYAPGIADNEQQSADWFAEKAANALSPEMISEVEICIMSTTHRERPTDEKSKFVVDVDLSGLGMEPKMFWHDGDNIRKEFAHLSDAEFAPKQSGFLQTLLDRERIYSTDFFHNLCEARARENIQKAIQRYAESVG